MRLARFALPAFVFCAGLSVARADEPKTYALDVKPAYKVGETWTITVHDQSHNDTKVAGPDGTVVFASDETDLVELTEIHQVVAVADDGSLAKEVIYFAKWKRLKGGQSVSDLAGTHLEVTGKGATRAWKLLTPEHALSDETKTWVEKKYGKDDKPDFGDTMKPSKAIAIGESWDVEPSKVVSAMGNEMKVDAAKSSVQATLKSVDGDLATVRFVIKLQAVSFPAGPGAEMKVLEGGMFEIEAEGRVPLAPTARGDSGGMTMKLQTKAAAPQDTTATLSIEGEMRRTFEVGGEVPAIPTLEPAAK